jgi:hypothetical protein
MASGFIANRIKALNSSINKDQTVFIKGRLEKIQDLYMTLCIKQKKNISLDF